MTRMQPTKSPTDAELGPGPEPADELLKWLDSNAKRDGERTWLRVPVVIGFEDEYRLALGESFVGGPKDDSSEGRVRLHFDDSGLGVGLLDTVQARCPEGQERCALWLEGHWGPLVTGPMAEDPPEGTHTFAVRKVGKLVESGDQLRVSVAKAP